MCQPVDITGDARLRRGDGERGRLERPHKRAELMHKCISRENECAEARRPENDLRGVMQSCISEARMHRPEGRP